MKLPELPDPFNAGHARQTDVHQHHIRQIARYQWKGLFHRMEASHDAVAGRAINQLLEPFTDLTGVFDDRDPDHDVSRALTKDSLELGAAGYLAV